MIDGKPSRTAIAAAEARATHRYRDPYPWIFDDPYALSFAGDDFAFAKDQFLMDGAGLGLMVRRNGVHGLRLALLPAALQRLRIPLILPDRSTDDAIAYGTSIEARYEGDISDSLRLLTWWVPRWVVRWILAQDFRRLRQRLDREAEAARRWQQGHEPGVGLGDGVATIAVDGADDVRGL